MLQQPDSTPPTTTTLPTIHDVLIIGAGPSGLAVAARLREHTPSALYTDEEHRRFHWLRKHAGHSSVKDRKTGRVRTASHTPSSRDLLVLDAEGKEWLTRWNALFAAFRISHLRSPMFFHPDPGDRDALLAFAHERERTGELEEIVGCVGKELSKHKRKMRRREMCGGKCSGGSSSGSGSGNGRTSQAMAPCTVDERDRKDYFTPSRGMFRDFVGGVVGRYGLGGGSKEGDGQGVVREERVEDVKYGVVPQFSAEGGSEKLFTVRSSGGVHYAKAVVLAVGPGNAPCIPAPFGGIGMRHEAACHALTLRGDCGLPKALKAKVAAGKKTNVLVVGGGLTSAQVGDLVLKQGVTKVWHLMRGTLKVKPFDIDLNWMSKFRNQEKAAFWMADDDYERAEMLKEARGGGSITPRFAKTLLSHVQSGRTALHYNTTVQSQTYNADSQTWAFTTSPPIPDLPEIDYIYFATGVQSDISTLPYMQSIVSEYPVETYDGLPALTDDLAWRDDVPLFCAGKFAGLRLGPGAANLEGARAGAERIVLAVEKMLGSGEEKTRRDSGYEGEGEGVDGKRYEAGLGSRYEALSMDE